MVRYNDQDLYSPEQLVKRVRNDQPGAEVELEDGRAGKLRTAIKNDTELPEPQREQLLRTLDDRGEGEFRLPRLPAPSRPFWMPWQRELFDWPNLSF